MFKLKKMQREYGFDVGFDLAHIAGARAGKDSGIM
jgi:hypothetical protein